MLKKSRTRDDKGNSGKEKAEQIKVMCPPRNQSNKQTKKQNRQTKTTIKSSKRKGIK